MAPQWQQTRKTFRHGHLAEALVESALKRLETDGVEALSLRDLSREVGVNHRAAYRHFPDKLSLLARVAEAGWRRMAQRVKHQTAGRSKGEQRLIGAGLGFFLFARGNPNLFHFMAGPRINKGGAFPALEQAMVEALTPFRQAFIDSGMKSDVSVVRAAVFVSALQGVTTQILHHRLHVSRANAKDFISDICRKLFAGLH